jgi:hypothetical protein
MDDDIRTGLELLLVMLDDIDTSTHDASSMADEISHAVPGIRGAIDIIRDATASAMNEIEDALDTDDAEEMPLFNAAGDAT